MGYSESLEAFVARMVERVIATRFSERHGIVTSYDSQNHRAKVMFQPSGQTSGWLPIETGQIGNGYGIACGLEAGDGKTTGDQVIVRFQENDFEGGKIVQCVHSAVDKPPQVESGEMVMWTKWGQQVRFNKDGSLTLKTGVQTQPDQPAQNQVTSPQYTPTGAPTQQQTPQSNMKSSKTVTMTLDAYGNHIVQNDGDHVVQAGGNQYAQASNIGNSASGTIAHVAGGDLGMQAGGRNVHIGKEKVVINSGNVSASRSSNTVKGDAAPMPSFEVPSG